MTTQLKERPVIFTAEEVSAVLAGDKTQHRVSFDFEFKINTASLNETADDIGWSVQKLITRAYHEAVYDFECPFGAIGDRLWVQEPTHTANSWDWFYDATHSLVKCKDPYTPSDLYLPWDDDHQEYTGPIDAEHMPYWASRLILEITDIRIERVQDITLGDSLKEACNGPMDFAIDWMSKHGEGEWFINPWVWVIEFKKVDD